MRRIRHVLRRVLGGRSGGFTFAEVTIAIIVLALMIATIPPLLVMVTKSEFRQNEHRIAESLTRSQMEYVKSQSYIAANTTDPYPQYELFPVPNETYEIEVIAQPIHVDPVTREHTPLDEGEDEGLQEITVKIHHADRLVLETRGHKVDR